MVEAAFAVGAIAASYWGFALLALRQRPHHSAVVGARRRISLEPALLRGQLLLGCLALALSLALSLAAQGPSFGGIFFSFALSTGALGVMFTLSYRPHWLRPVQRAASAIRGSRSATSSNSIRTGHVEIVSDETR